jgi:uncharacterized protein (DUF58 family)
MLTSRGCWFFLVVSGVLAAATIVGATPLMVVSLTCLLWFLVQWCLFQVRTRLCIPRLTVQRVLRTERGQAETVWAGQTVEVVVEVRSEGAIGLPMIVLMDRLPALARLTHRSLRAEGTLAPGQPLLLTYMLSGRAPGVLRFEGIQARLADLQGFFTCAAFLREPRSYRVLPGMIAAARTTRLKKYNVLPLVGTHRHVRPGTGSELLDLRDYLPGDPPKMIAWKVSARRDRLITREFESEVPIRCTLFLDVSSSVRVGPAGQTPLTRLVEIAAGIAHANASQRDLTGLCFFDDTGVSTRIAPARGSRHLLKMIDALTRAAGLPPYVPHARLRELLPLAFGLIQDVYPDWLERDVNAFPFWLPFWSPQPYATIPQPPLPAGPWWQRPWIWLRRRLRHSVLTRHHRREWRFSRVYQREYRWRKQVAAVLSVRYALGPGGLARLLEDDPLFVEYIQRFLAEHQTAFPYPLYDEEGRYLFAAPAKAGVLAQALLQGVAHGKDNELFVLCVDLLESSDDLAALAGAVRAARGRHHQVVVICPWPAELAPPGRPPAPAAPGDVAALLDLQRLLQRMNAARMQQAYARLRHAFGRLGVPVICAADKDPVAWILHRMRRLRIMERGVR